MDETPALPPGVSGQMGAAPEKTPFGGIGAMMAKKPSMGPPSPGGGGADPVAVLNKYPGRVRTIHIKTNGGGPEAVIGEDRIDWKAVFDFCETKGNTDWYVVEHETSKDPLDAVKRSFAALKKMGKV